MEKQEGQKLLRKLAQATLTSILDDPEEHECPLKKLSEDHQTVLSHIMVAATAVSPHLLAHLLLYAYEAGKEYSEEEYLKKMFQT